MRATPDPVLQAITALCSHPGHELDCPACGFRRRACIEHLDRMVREIAATLDWRAL